jgi:hypothetical protein
VIYLDSAAVIKLLRREQATEELVTWLNDRSSASLVSSVLAEVEVPRALRRAAPQALVGVPTVLSRLYRIEMPPSGPLPGPTRNRCCAASTPSTWRRRKSWPVRPAPTSWPS